MLDIFSPIWPPFVVDKGLGSKLLMVKLKKGIESSPHS